METNKADVIIIGAGPVGLFAAFQLGMLGMQSIIIDGLPHIGGQCSALYPEKPIYDIPAYPKISGQELVDQLVKQVAPFNPAFHIDQKLLSFKKVDSEFEVLTDKGKYYSKVIVIAAGAGLFEPNRPPIPNIELYENKYIFYSVPNRSLFTGKRVVIAGGGDSAVDWAINLSEITSHLYLVHRRDKFRAMDATLSRLQELIASGKIELVAPYQLDNIVGNEGKLDAVIVRDLNGNAKELKVDYLLPFYGLKMNSDIILSQGVESHRASIKVEPSTMETNINGVYSVGDGCYYPGKLKLILTGFAESALAAHSAYQYIFPGKALHFEHSTSKGVHAISESK